MPVAVVDLLHPIDVDEGDDEAPIGAAGAGDLLAEGEGPDLAAEGAGQVVEVGTVEGLLEQRALCPRQPGRESPPAALLPEHRSRRSTARRPARASPGVALPRHAPWRS